MCLIWQTKCPICGIKWLKGFWIPSAYDRDTAYRSCNSNCDSPCITQLLIVWCSVCMSYGAECFPFKVEHFLQLQSSTGNYSSLSRTASGCATTGAAERPIATGVWSPLRSFRRINYSPLINKLLIPAERNRKCNAIGGIHGGAWAFASLGRR